MIVCNMFWTSFQRKTEHNTIRITLLITITSSSGEVSIKATALFQNIFKFCTLLPKFSNILPFFNIFLLFFVLFLKNRTHALTLKNRPCTLALAVLLCHLHQNLINPLKQLSKVLATMLYVKTALLAFQQAHHLNKPKFQCIFQDMIKNKLRDCDLHFLVKIQIFNNFKNTWKYSTLPESNFLFVYLLWSIKLSSWIHSNSCFSLILLCA